MMLLIAHSPQKKPIHVHRHSCHLASVAERNQGAAISDHQVAEVSPSSDVGTLTAPQYSYPICVHYDVYRCDAAALPIVHY
jgi:hypothetical protein